MQTWFFSFSTQINSFHWTYIETVYVTYIFIIILVIVVELKALLKSIFRVIWITLTGKIEHDIFFKFLELHKTSLP